MPKTNSKSPAHSVYIHIPFCRKRCSYCDFNTVAGIESWIPNYVNALCQEIVKVTSANGSRFPVHTIFLGGGTPSLLAPNQMEKILQTINDRFLIAHDVEITMEANPGAIVDAHLNDYFRLGVNRISFGMQSARDSELKLLRRIHTHQDTIHSISIARKAGFENINLDLIYNLPGQTIQDWHQNLQAALEFEPEHLSLYALSVEEGTLLERQISSGVYEVPDDDHAADLMQESIPTLEQSGYLHYEISNWAKPGFTCRHNQQYWKNLPYFGFGAGAHGMVNNIRTINETGPIAYLKQCQEKNEIHFPAGPACIQSHRRTRNEQIEDHMILNLRLLEDGVNRETFHQIFGVRLIETYPDVISQLVQSGYLEWDKHGHNLRLAPQHFFIANQILVKFLLDEY